MIHEHKSHPDVHQRRNAQGDERGNERGNEPGSEREGGRAAAAVQRQPRGAAPGGVDAAIHGSARSVAQRRQLGSLFGPAAQRKPDDTGLPPQLKAGVESLSAVSMDRVRVHYNSALPAQLHALAYARGSDIHVAPGQEAHLPHEAWHVVQQAQGRVQPTMQMKGGVPVNDDEGLEREADRMGAMALAAGAQQAAAGAGMGAGSGAVSDAGSRSEPGAAPTDTLATGTLLQARFDHDVVQCDIDMPYGTWKTEKYEPWVGDGSEEGQELDRRGCAMQLAFHPKNTVDAKKIGLVQELQSFVGGQVEGAGNPNSQIHPDQSARNVPLNAPVGGGHRIDRGPGETVPVYGAEIPSVAKTKNWSAIKIGQPETQLGYRYKPPGPKSEYTTKAAKLLDTPNRRNAETNSRMEFETTALAVEGAQAGTYYGSVRWGWRTDGGGAYELIPLAMVSEAQPSATFMAAAEQWNQVEGGRGGLTLPIQNKRADDDRG